MEMTKPSPEMFDLKRIKVELRLGHGPVGNRPFEIVTTVPYIGSLAGGEACANIPMEFLENIGRMGPIELQGIIDFTIAKSIAGITGMDIGTK